MTTREGSTDVQAASFLARTPALVLVGLLAVSGCGSDDKGQGAPASSVSEIAAVMSSGEANYEPAEGPEQLAKDSDLVVEGRLTNFEDGPVFGRSIDAPDAVPSLVVEVAVDQILSGQLPPGAEGKVVYVLDFGQDAKAHDEVVPDDAPALLYLTEQSPASITPDAPVQNEEAGRPSGQPTFGFTTPQGLLIEFAGSVIQPLESIQYPDLSLDKFDPSEKEFPDNSIPVEPEQFAPEQGAE